MAPPRDGSGVSSAAVECTMLLVAMVCVYALCVLPVPLEAEPSLERNLHEWHAACVMIAGFSMVVSYCDDVPVLISSEGKSVRLEGRLRWHTLGLQNYTLMLVYFLIASCLDAGVTLPRFLRAARVLLAITYPVSVGTVVFYSLVLLPAYRRAGNRWARLGLGGRPRPLIVYSSSVVMLTGELVLTRRLIAWRDMPALVLFAIWYCSHHVDFVKRHKLSIFDALDFRRPGAVLRHLGVLLLACTIFTIGPLATRSLLAAPIGQLASPLALLAGTMVFVPLWGPKDPKGNPTATKADKTD